MSVTGSGMLRLVKLEHPEKAPSPIEETEFGRSMPNRFVHFQNARIPISVMVLGISMLRSSVHCENADSPIAVTVIVCLS